MADESTVKGDLYVSGQGRFGSLVIPAGPVKNESVPNGEVFDATKIEHQYATPYTQAAGGAVISETRNVRIAYAAGEVIGLSAMVDTAPTGADRTITVDLQKGNAGTGFVTLLS